tara:strand:- start:824 stop:1087 length:264 start_codon:yes stop_codon:yes gene_type:complete
MKYKCKTVSLFKMMVDYSGMGEPLCSFCQSRDCDNPIERREVSVIGENKDFRLYIRGSEVFAVVECEGFIHSPEDEDSEDEGDNDGS